MFKGTFKRTFLKSCRRDKNVLLTIQLGLLGSQSSKYWLLTIERKTELQCSCTERYLANWLIDWF